MKRLVDPEIVRQGQLLAGADRVEVLGRPYVERVVDRYRGCLAAIVQRAGRKKLVLVTRRNHMGIPLKTEPVDLPFRVDRRGTVASSPSYTLLPDDLSRRGVQATGNSLVVKQEQPVTDQQGSRALRD